MAEKTNTCVKRVRDSGGSNYTIFEKELLIELVTKYEDAIQSKKTVIAALKAKDATWSKIEAEFNRNAQVTSRKKKQLQQFYANLKRNAKKARSEERIERYKTGGGSCSTSNELDDSVLSLIQDQADPDQNSHDSDAAYYGEAGSDMESSVQVVAVIEEPDLSSETTCEVVHVINCSIESKANPLPGISVDTPVARNAENTAKGKESSRLNKTRLCRSGISALADSRTRLCNKEMELIQEKYRTELELLEMKKECERKRREVLEEKLLYYKEKRSFLSK